MIHRLIFFIAILIISSGCSGQSGKEGNAGKGDNNVPQTNVKVNKKYDKNGNLIQYDSTYSYSYSNMKNDSHLKDSIFNNFRNQFSQKFSFSNDHFFNDWFFNDSLLKNDFYTNDYFLKRFRDNMRKMDSLFWSMDTLKNNFYSRQFRVPGPLKVPK